MLKNFIIGDWSIEPSHNLIKNAQKEVKLEPQAMAVLCYLAQNCDRPVSIAELIEVIWKNKVVTDHVVYKTMTRLRKALASDQHQQNYIKTISKKGYLLQFSVEGIESEDLSQSQQLTQTPDKAGAEEGITTPPDNREDALNEKPQELSFFVSGLNIIKEKRLSFGIATLVLLGLVAWFSGVDAYWHSLNQKVYSKVTKLAQIEDIEYLPLLSPDNKYLLLATQKEMDHGKRSLKILHLDSHKTYSLTDGQHDYGDFAWSHSGNAIVASKLDGPVTNPTACQLVLIKLNSDSTRIKTEEALTKCSLKSSDVAYDDVSGVIYYDYAETALEPSNLYSIDPLTHKIEQLTTSKESGEGDIAVELSPDRKKLAFIRISEKRGKHILMLYDLEKEQEKELSPLPSYYNELSWTPDSEGIIYQATRNEVVYFSLEHEYHKTIASSAGQLNEPRHSLNEESLISVHYVDSNDIYRTSNLTDFSAKKDPMLISSGGRDLFPAYANKSYQIAYSSNRGGPWQIWLREEDGTERKLTSLKDDGFPSKAHWSPDDSKVIATYDDKIILVDVAEASHQVIYQSNDTLPVNIAWGSDGKTILFSGNKDDVYQIYRLDIETKTLEQVTERGGFDMVSEPNGRYFYFLKYHQPGVWRYDLEKNLEEKILDKGDRGSLWTLQIRGSDLYFGHYDGLGYIYKYNLLSEEAELVVTSAEIDMGISISFDQNYLLWNQMRVMESSLNKHKP